MISGSAIWISKILILNLSSVTNYPKEHGELVATEREKEITDAQKLLPRLWARILGN